MTQPPTRYPLQWPVGWKRYKSYERKSGRFSRNGKPITVAGAVERVLEELQRLGVSENDVVISTNLLTRLDGFPRSDLARPSDVGVAVYWQKSSKEPMRCMATDIYDEVEDNLAAIAATLDALRAIERHGGAVILDRAFMGFTALPAPIVAGMKRPWWEVLQLQRDSTADEVKAAYRRLASEHHPDRPGGSANKMAEINAAQEEALQEVRQ